MQDFKYKIQKRTANIISVGCLAIFLLNFFLKIIIKKNPFNSFLSYNIPILIIAILIFISKFKFSKFFQSLQVSVIFITAFLTIISYTSIRNITGETIVVFCVYLATQYGFFRNFFTLKILLLLFFVISVKLIKIYIFANQSYPSYEDLFFFVSQYILLSIMFSLFAFNGQEELNNYIKQKIVSEDKYYKNEIYIDLGKVVRAFIHDLKAIGGTWLTLKLAKESLAEIVINDNDSKEKIKNVLDQIERSIQLIGSVYDKQDTINNIAYSKYKIKPEIINISDMMNHILNYLNYTYYLRDITVTQDSPHELLIQAVPFEIVQAIENILKNSIEAMENSIEKQLTIKIGNENASVKIIISDTGGGITFAKEDGFVNSDVFIIGRTTKENGTGWGVSSAINFIEKNHGSIEFYSIKDHSTSVVVKFKLYQGDWNDKN